MWFLLLWILSYYLDRYFPLGLVTQSCVVPEITGGAPQVKWSTTLHTDISYQRVGLLGSPVAGKDFLSPCRSYRKLIKVWKYSKINQLGTISLSILGFSFHFDVLPSTRVERVWRDWCSSLVASVGASSVDGITWASIFLIRKEKNDYNPAGSYLHRDYLSAYIELV